MLMIARFKHVVEGLPKVKGIVFITGCVMCSVANNTSGESIVHSLGGVQSLSSG